VKYYILRYANVLILFGIRKYCHTNEMSILLYQLLKEVVMKQISIILPNTLLSRFASYIENILGILTSIGGNILYSYDGKYKSEHY
jgi:hypothetical protein